MSSCITEGEKMMNRKMLKPLTVVLILICLGALMGLGYGCDRKREKGKAEVIGFPQSFTELVEKVNTAIVTVKAALEGKDSARIRAETEKLQKVLGEAASAAYQQTAQRQAEEQAGPQAGPAGNSGTEAGGKSGDNVVDADFKVHDEK